MKYELPQVLPEALRALRAEEKRHLVLGERFIDAYAAVKELEHQEFMRVLCSEFDVNGLG